MRYEDPELLARCAELTEIGADAYLKAAALAAANLVPSEPEDIPTWAKNNVIIPTSVSDRSGPYEMNAIQCAIARMWQDPFIRQVDYLKIARAGATLLISTGMAYHTGHLGFDSLFFERTEPDAQAFHDKKLYQILMASPSLAAMMRPDTKAGIQDGWSDRIFRNGASLQLRSGNKPIKSIKGLFVAIDEAGDEKYSKGPEGNIVTVVRGRLQEFCAPILFVCGTPTVVGCCISDEYSRSDKRHWYMPCPHCQEMIRYEPDVRPGRRDQDTGTGLRYVRNERGVVEDSWYACACGGLIEETSKIEMLEAGEFRATDIGEPGHVGCYTSAAHSTDPQMTWRHVGANHHASLRNEKTRQAYVNLTLAQPYDPAPPILVDTTKLQENVLDAEALPDGIDCPEDAVYLVAAIDNQKGVRDDPRNPPRGEMTVMAACRNNRWHVIAHHVISHLVQERDGHTKRIGFDPFDEDYADQVWDILDKEYVAGDGRLLKIRKCLVDVGWQTEAAYKFCTLPGSRERGILPIRGDTTERAGRRVTLLPTNGTLRKSKKSGRNYLWIGTRDAKDECARRLAIPAPAPGSISFSRSLPETYFEGLIAERLVETKPGVSTWVQTGSNTGEPWDCLQYWYAAKELVIVKNRRLREEVDAVDPTVAQAAIEARLATEEASTIVEGATTDLVVQPPLQGSGSDADPPLQGSGSDADPPEQEAVSSSGLRMRVVERKTRRTETTPEVTSRIERIRRRQSRSGVGW
ncbi:hypothetical protein NS365_05510 [Aureimonas ureilytica]|uniref:Terminase n=1 Tax=Aureimonas ureilytica TaxID=401562 RepID=A0A175RVL8_9HYPH|nr:terminase gpA endonuclease subunit [Aureimonas ureilytica]KTR06892.1 hypothetical protein NS365_05510 [Aureimonas ureilytica]